MAGSLVLNIVISIVALIRSGKSQSTVIEGQPINVKFAEKFVNKEECQRFHQHQDARISKLESEFSCIRQEMKTDRNELRELITEEVGKVHNRVNVVLEAVAEVRGALKKN